MTAPPSDQRGSRHGSKRPRREPVTLDLKATSASTAQNETSSAVEPATTAGPLEPETPVTIPEASIVPIPEPSAATVDSRPSDEGPAHTTGASTGARPEHPADRRDEIGEEAQPKPVLAPDTATDIGKVSPWETAAAAESPQGPASAPEPTRAESLAAEPPTAPVPVRRRGPGFGSLLVASLLGGVAGAALSLAAERYWLRPVDATETRIARLEQRAAPAAAADLGGLERRLAALEGEQKATAERVRAAEGRADANAQRLEQALQRPDAPPAPASPATPDGNAPSAAVAEQVNLRIAALEEQLRARAETEAGAVQRLEARVAEQAQQVAPLAAQLTDVTQRLNAVAAQAGERDRTLASLGQQLAEQNQRLGTIAQQVTEGQPERAAALRVVAADQVANALRDGAPYAEALAALRRLNTPPDQLAALEPFAASGAPTPRALAREFAPLRERIVAETREPVNDWGDRLQRMAAGIITVRPIGRPSSGSAEPLARIDEALARGNFKDAAASWDTLPEPARGISAEFGRKLKARAAADDAARALSGQALAAVSAPTR